MATRRFGPTLGAGVVVIEQEAEKVLEAAPLGVTLYVTPLDHGSLSELTSCYSKSDMLRKVGGLIEGYDGPDCAADFWDHSGGAGELHFLRVARSGIAAPRAASIDLYSREQTSAGAYARAVARFSAKNGGRWGSQKRAIWRATTLLADIGVTTLTTGLTMQQDEWVGGVVRLDGVTTRDYAIIANTTAGVITVSPESTMSADLAGVPSVDQGYQLVLSVKTGPEGLKRAVSVEVASGEQNPTTEFSLNIFVNEQLIRRYPDLSMDPTSLRYFVRLINDDQGNEEITATDLLTPGLVTPDRRPANESGVTAAITATTLQAKLFQLRNAVVGDANPTAAIGTTNDNMQHRDTLRFEVTADGANATIRMTSRRLGGGAQVHADVIASNTATTPFVFGAPTSPIVPPITITCGTTVFQVGDIFEVDYFPMEVDKLIGGLLVPDFVNSPNTKFRITDNDHRTITIGGGDLVVDGLGAVNDRFTIIYPQELGGPDLAGGTAVNGTNGLAGLSDTDYTAIHLSTSVSRARDLLNQNKGLVKLATPDRTATSVVQAGMALAESLNWQYRVEIPDTVVTESAAIDHINSVVGRNDFAVTSWPSYADAEDPERPGQLKRIPTTGMIHGREAMVAKNYDGYHKAAAGIDVTLPRIVKLPFTNLINEEATNPVGINVIKKVKGRFIIWGDRTIALDPAWKFKHQRELMSHFENRLREGFDFIVFAINDITAQALLITTLRAFFQPEFAKGAVKARPGKGFEDAVSIKIDSDNNTLLTQAGGDLYADIKLRLADTVERFIIRIGKAGIFEDVQPA